MRIFITGATGFIGKQLCKKFREDGHDLVCLNHEKTDINDKDIDLQGAEVVFHLAGLLGKWGVPEADYWKVNYEGTKNILEASKKAGIRNFIYLSTGGVSGPLLNNELADETYPYKPSNIYEKTKVEAEKEVLKYSNDFVVTSLRPEFVYGPEDKHVLGLFQAVKNRFPLFAGGKSKLHPTYIDDVIFCCLASWTLN